MAEALTVWSLEMLDPAQLRPAARQAALETRECTLPQWELNRFLYQLVGAPWQWHAKLGWSEEQWRAWTGNPDLRTWIAWHSGTIAGYYELHRQSGDSVEIAYFGLAPRFIGKGLGGDMLGRCIADAWALGARRVWVHTCSLDHPSALANYQSRGLKIFSEEQHAKS
jgi:RimJ/RimL family protein N-acetyltransferase